ncbi:MAG: hypothetical protein KAT58_00645 [candidate division Zixibacteria bacterium]|nr:hypothetical protein [candidate division Zixibacteria bacterium]
MGDIKRAVIKKSLKEKGFRLIKGKGRGDHEKLCFYHKGKRYPNITVVLSRGSGYKTYSTPLLKYMKPLVHLDKLEDLQNLFRCPMSCNHYLSILKKKELL